MYRLKILTVLFIVLIGLPYVEASGKTSGREANLKSNDASHPVSILVPPANDECAGAELIPGGGPFPILTAITDMNDATLNGTDDPVAGSCNPGVGVLTRSIWYAFTPSQTDQYTFSTCLDSGCQSTVKDPIVTIYTSLSGCTGPFTEIPTSGNSDGCDDDGCINKVKQSLLSTELTAGTTYYIVIWAFDDVDFPTNNEIQIRVSRGETTPLNDTCAAPESLSSGIPADGIVNVLTGAEYITDADDCFTGINQNIPAAAHGREVVYTFTAPTAGKYSFRVDDYEAAANHIIYLSDTCPPDTGSVDDIVDCSIGSNRAQITFGNSEEIKCVPLSAGQEVFLFVDEFGLTAGSTFRVEASPCVEESEPNGTVAAADNFTCGVVGAMDPALDVDFFSVGTPPATSRIFAFADSGAAGNTNLQMRVTNNTSTLEFDENNNDFAYGFEGSNIAGRTLDGSASFIRLNMSTPGETTEPYRLFSVVQPSLSHAIPESEPNNTTGQADSNQLNYYAGSLSGPAPSTDVDFYQFTASAGDVIFLSVDGDPLRDNTPINAALALHDSSGAVVASANDEGETSNTAASPGTLTGLTPFSPGEALVYTVSNDGTYYVSVAIGTTSNGNHGAGDYLLSISLNCEFRCPAITVSPALIPGGTQGAPYNQSFSAVGGMGAYTFSITSGALPAGLTLAPNGTLSGTPTVPGVFNITVTATDGNGCPGSRAYTLNIACAAISLTPPALPDGSEDVPYNQAVAGNGGTGPYTFAVTSGTLPAGLNLAANGTISGTPTDAGTSFFTMTATDVNNCTGDHPYSISISCPNTVISPDTLPSGRQDEPYNQTISASGGVEPYVFTISSGTLPNGITLSAAGLLSGTPTESGSFVFDVTATDANTCAEVKTYTLNITDCLFCDDFEDSNIPTDWTFVKPTWNETGGALTGTPVKKKAIAIADPVFQGCSICTINSSMRTAGGIGNRVWLLGWYIDKRNTIELMMKQETGRWILKRRVNGSVVQKAKAVLPITINTDYQIEMSFDGTNITVTIDGVQALSLAPTGAPQGTVGFQAKGTTGTFQFIDVN